MTEEQVGKLVGKYATRIMVLVLILLVFFKSYFVVDPGYTAMHLRMGAFVRACPESGLYFKIPLVDNVIYINNRICKKIISTSALSKDLQTVTTEVAINYRIRDAIALYKSVGTNFEAIILDPYSQESIKAVEARYTAEDLITMRDKAREQVFTELRNRLDPIFISLIDFNFVHLDFTSGFIHAVEEKQIAEQLAKTAHNNTERTKELALQTKIEADAEAYSLNVKKTCTTPEIIALKKIEKWDGRLPNVYGSSLPMLSILDK